MTVSVKAFFQKLWLKFQHAKFGLSEVAVVIVSLQVDLQGSMVFFPGSTTDL